MIVYWYYWLRWWSYCYCWCFLWLCIYYFKGFFVSNDGSVINVDDSGDYIVDTFGSDNSSVINVDVSVYELVDTFVSFDGFDDCVVVSFGSDDGSIINVVITDDDIFATFGSIDVSANIADNSKDYTIVILIDFSVCWVDEPDGWIFVSDDCVDVDGDGDVDSVDESDISVDVSNDKLMNLMVKLIILKIGD